MQTSVKEENRGAFYNIWGVEKLFLFLKKDENMKCELCPGQTEQPAADITTLTLLKRLQRQHTNTKLVVKNLEWY